MTTHEHLSIEILADYAEGLLGDADATSVAEHLASCSDCQAEADLLVSVSTLLAADDPGPMPAHFAARIDAALADLAAAEPVTPRSSSTTVGKGEGATVIDLASRRRFTPAARVTSVAASLVLLIGGVALGMQALDTTDAGDPGDGLTAVGPGPTPTSTSARYLAYALSAQAKPKGNNAQKLKDGSVVDKRTGTKFLKNGKVLFPDGVVVVPKKDGAAEVRTYDVQSGKSRKIATFQRGETEAARPTVTVPPPTNPAVENTPKATPSPDATTPKPTPSPAATTAVAPNQTDPYVTASNDTYTPDNFAAKVQALLRSAGETADGAAGGGTTNTTDRNRVSSGAVRSDDAAVPARGPAPAEVAAKVKRCATQLKLTGELLAGDAGVWRNQAATIIVTRNGSEPKQAVGYVVYGDCTNAAPATAADVQWEMRVDFPTAEEAPAPTTSNSSTNTVTPSVKASTVTPSSVTGTATNLVTNSTEQ